MLLCVLQVSHSGTVLDAHSLTATLLSPLAPVEGKIYVTAYSRGHVYTSFLLSNPCYHVLVWLTKLSIILLHILIMLPHSKHCCPLSVGLGIHSACSMEVLCYVTSNAVIQYVTTWDCHRWWLNNHPLCSGRSPLLAGGIFRRRADRVLCTPGQKEEPAKCHPLHSHSTHPSATLPSSELSCQGR